MFANARSIRAILAIKNGLWAYFTALDEKRSVPAIAAVAKAAQVTGSTTRVSSVIGRLLEAIPKSLKSTMLIEPTTRVMASTWTDSRKGKRNASSRIAVEKGRS